MFAVAMCVYASGDRTTVHFFFIVVNLVVHLLFVVWKVSSSDTPQLLVGQCRLSCYHFVLFSIYMSFKKIA